MFVVNLQTLMKEKRLSTEEVLIKFSHSVSESLFILSEMIRVDYLICRFIEILRQRANLADNFLT